MLSTPFRQESLFHRSIMDLGFCNVILVKEENLDRALAVLAGALGTGLLGPCFVLSFSSFDGTRMDCALCSRPTGGDRQAWSFPQLLL